MGNIELDGNAAVTGATADDWEGLIRNYDLARANPTPLPNSKKFQLRVQHPHRFHASSYIELQSGRYKVTTVDNNANSLELLALTTKSNETLASEEIALIPLALSATLPATNDRNIELPIANNESTNFAIGQSISIQDHDATINSLGDSSINITWNNEIPTQALAEGSTISLGILGARSSTKIFATDNNSLIGGREENANIAVNGLFEQSFGLSKNDLLGLANQYGQRNGKSFDYQIGTALQSTTKLEGLYYTEDSVHFSASQPLCGSALLIVAANVSVDEICAEGFSGLLYVFGNYTQTAGTINGAVVSEATSAPTLLSGNASINYNATALNQWQAYLQDALASTDGKQSFQQVSGSWRLE